MKVWHLARREWSVAFRSPLGYILLAVYALLSGAVFLFFLERFRQASLRVAQSPYLVDDLVVPLTPDTWLVQPYVTNLAQILVFFIPFLTMGSIAGERRSGSLEILLSYPLSTGQIVAGKFLGAFLIYASLVAVNFIHVLLLAFVQPAGPGMVLTSLLGLLLMGASAIALGIVVSSFSQGPLEAAILTLGLLAGLALAGGSESGEGWRAATRFLSPLGHLEDLGRGILSPSAVLAYGAGTLASLAMAIRGVDWLRWRGA